MFDKLASEMAIVHNMLIRGLNSIYLQAPHIQPADTKPFARYILGWSQGLHSHHDGEETMFFPAVEKMTGVQGVMDGNIEQHKKFHDGLEQLQAYANDVVAGKEAYDGGRVVGIINAFGPALSQHLSDEIPTIQGLRQYGDKMAGLPKLFDEEGEKAMVCHHSLPAPAKAWLLTRLAGPEGVGCVGDGPVLRQHRREVRGRPLGELAARACAGQGPHAVSLLVDPCRFEEVWCFG